MIKNNKYISILKFYGPTICIKIYRLPKKTKHMKRKVPPAHTHFEEFSRYIAYTKNKDT